MGQIYLVRHGQASFGQANYDQLSGLGQEQGQMLGRWFAQRGQQFDRVIVGSMARHQQTADACFSSMDGPASTREIQAGFNEYDHHDMLIKHWPAFADPSAVKAFLAQSPHPMRAFQLIFDTAMARWMGGLHDAEYAEAWPHFQARCVKALQDLVASAHASQDIVVFTSGGTIATLCQHVLGLPDAQMRALNYSIANASVTRLFYQPDRLVLSYLNNFSHLELFGTAESVTYR